MGNSWKKGGGCGNTGAGRGFWTRGEGGGKAGGKKGTGISRTRSKEFPAKQVSQEKQHGVRYRKHGPYRLWI